MLWHSPSQGLETPKPPRRRQGRNRRSAQRTYLGVCPHDQVLQLDDLVIDGGTVPLLDDVVRRPSFSFFGWLELLDSPGDLLDGHFLLPHHHRHRGQDGPAAAHQGLGQAQAELPPG